MQGDITGNVAWKIWTEYEDKVNGQILVKTGTF